MLWHYKKFSRVFLVSVFSGRLSTYTNFRPASDYPMIDIDTLASPRKKYPDDVLQGSHCVCSKPNSSIKIEHCRKRTINGARC